MFPHRRPSRANTERLRFSLGLCLTLTAAASVFVTRDAFADPHLADDAPVDKPVFVPDLLDQDQPAIAFGAGTYLAVWRDAGTGNGSGSIRASRLDLSGELKDTPALIIVDKGDPAVPAVTFDGKRFLVVWTGGDGVHGAYVDTLGAVTAPFVVKATSKQFKAVVSGGNGFALVAWQDTSTIPVRIRAQLYDATGSVLRSDFAVSAGTSVADAPVVSWGGQPAMNFFVAWEEGNPPNRQILGATVATNGIPSAPFAIAGAVPMTHDVFDPAVAADGTTYVVSWTDLRMPGVDTLYARAVPFASPPSAPEFVLADPMGGAFDRSQLTFVNGKLLAAWEAYDSNSGFFELYGGRFLADGTRSDGDGARISSMAPSDFYLLPSEAESRRSAIATDGTHAFLTWSRVNFGLSGNDVFTLPVDATGVRLAPAPSKPLARGYNEQRHESVATNGTVFLLVWEDKRNEDTSGLDIYGLRTDLDGKPLDPAPFVISDAAGNQFAPSVAALAGGDFLVAWADLRDDDPLASPRPGVNIYAARVSSMMPAAPRDPLGIAVCSAPNAQILPSVAAAGDHWLVAWEDWRNDLFAPLPPPSEIHTATVAGDGTVGAVASLTTITGQMSTSACAPAAAWDGKNFFVAFELPCHLVKPAQGDVRGRWVGPDGASASEIIAVAASAVPETSPQVAASAKGIVVTWSQSDNAAPAIYAAQLADKAIALSGPPVVVASGAGTPEAPAVTFAADARGGVALFSWITTTPPGVQALRTDENLVPLGAPFAVTGAATLRGMPIAAVDIYGTRLADAPEATPIASVAAAATGQSMIAYDVIERLGGRDLARVHFRSLGVKTMGAACQTASVCADGICTGGACCNVPCDGICQACGATGCNAAPTIDPRCGGAGAISCASLDTICRSFHDQPANRCVAFGQCAEPGRLLQCTSYSNAAEGTACTSAACASAGSCASGVCQCDATPIPPFSPRLPPASGCSVGDRSTPRPGVPWLLLVALAWRLARSKPAARKGVKTAWGSSRRLVATAVLGVMTSACGGDASPGLDVNLRLLDPVFIATASARVIISTVDGTAIAASMGPRTISKGLTMRSLDADGDGTVDLVLDLGPAYPFDKLNRLELVPSVLTHAVNVTLRAEVYDGFGNRFARIGGSSRVAAADRVAAVLSPGQVATAPDLEPDCVVECPNSTVKIAAQQGDQSLAFAGKTALTAMASGNLTGSMPARADLVVAAAGEARPDGGAAAMAPNAGRAVLFFGGPGRKPNLAGDALVVGAASGDRLGAAIAVGDLDGDGKDDLVLGAPGASGGDGAAYVIYGAASWSALIDLAAAPAGRVARVSGTGGEALGSAFAFADLDGDGKAELCIGAPNAGVGANAGAGAVYAFHASELARDAIVMNSAAKLSLVGNAGSALGRALAGRGKSLAVGAPLESSGGKPAGAVYVVSSLAAIAQPASKVPRVIGEGGGFGSSLAFADLEGSGALSLIAAAADEGSGVVFVASTAALSATGESPPAATVRSAAAAAQLGAALGVIRRPLGDGIVLGAPARLPASAPGAGSAYVLSAATLRTLPSLRLGADGTPAEAAYQGAQPGDAFGSFVTLGDFDRDGVTDVAIGSDRGAVLFYGPLP